MIELKLKKQQIKLNELEIELKKQKLEQQAENHLLQYKKMKAEVELTVVKTHATTLTLLVGSAGAIATIWKAFSLLDWQVLVAVLDRWIQVIF